MRIKMCLALQGALVLLITWLLAAPAAAQDADTGSAGLSGILGILFAVAIVALMVPPVGMVIGGTKGVDIGKAIAGRAGGVAGGLVGAYAGLLLGHGAILLLSLTGGTGLESLPPLRTSPGTESQTASPPDAPALLEPADGAVFDHYPRTLKFRWQAVTGARSYTVEIDCYKCCQADRWCTDVGDTLAVIPDIKGTSYDFEFVGGQPGRWRVWGKNEQGKEMGRSPWRRFSFTQ